MKNLNDTKLTLQEKEHILRCSIDNNYKAKVAKAEREGKYYAPHMWIAPYECLLKMNEEAIKRDSWYSFSEEVLKEIYPLTSFMFYEGERVLEGEWDKTYERWSPYSYQRVFCVAVNGLVEEIDCGDDRFEMTAPTAEDRTGYELYPYTFDEDGENQGLFPMGLLDCPIQDGETMSCFPKRENPLGGMSNYHRFVNEIKQDAMKSLRISKGLATSKSRYNRKKKTEELKNQFKGGFQ